jgi:hypothetical protein
MAYANIEEANTYYSKIYNSNWSGISNEDKQVLLENATISIDKKEYSGVKVDESQANKFPRVFYDGSISDDSLVAQACIVEALNIYNNGGGDVDASGVESFKLGDVSVNLSDTNEDSSTEIDNLLKPYLIGNTRIVL